MQKFFKNLDVPESIFSFRKVMISASALSEKDVHADGGPGYDDAREELAKWYWTGKPGVPPRRALAVRMFLRQVQGRPYARFVPACAYALGDGVSRRSFRRAARWFASAVALFLEKERDALKWELGRFFRGILPKKKEKVRPPPETDEPDDSPATERSGA